MTFSNNGLELPTRLNTIKVERTSGMNEFSIVTGKVRTEVTLRASNLGDDIVVYIYNRNAHIGAVAIGDYDEEHQRASVSVHTRLGHKDDAIAQKAAYVISRSIKRPVCVIAGVHVNGITSEEIDQVLANADVAVQSFVEHSRQRGAEPSHGDH